MFCILHWQIIVDFSGQVPSGFSLFSAFVSWSYNHISKIRERKEDPTPLKRLCQNELQKEYFVKTKVIALDWQWVTLRSWCQMNRNGHSSPVKHKVEGKPRKMLEKLKIKSEKSTLFGYFLWSILVTCVDICISLNTNDITPILHTCLNSCWSYLCTTDGYLVVLLCFWVVRVKKKKTRASSWF